MRYEERWEIWNEDDMGKAGFIIVDEVLNFEKRGIGSKREKRSEKKIKS